MNNSVELSKIRLSVVDNKFAGTPKEYRAFKFLLAEIDRQYDAKQDSVKMSGTLFETIESAIYQLGKLEDLLDMPARGCTRNHFNALMRTLKEGVTSET